MGRQFIGLALDLRNKQSKEKLLFNLNNKICSLKWKILTKFELNPRKYDISLYFKKKSYNFGGLLKYCQGLIKKPSPNETDMRCCTI